MNVNENVLVSNKKKPNVLQRLWKNIKKDKFLLILSLPALLNYIIFHYLPMYGVIIAFKDYKLREGILGSPWASRFGLDNIISFVQNPYFGTMLWNTVALNLLYIIVLPIPGIIFALFLNELSKSFFKKITQTVSYIPNFLSSVIVVGIFMLLLNPNTGFVNKLIISLGQDPIYFQMDPRWFRPLMILMSIWQSTGWSTIIWLARIATIDPALYEAARVDGASRVQRMRFITLPAFAEWYFVTLVLGIAGIFGSSGFDMNLLLYNASTAPTANTMAMYMYSRGLRGGDFGYGAAIGFLQSMICLILVFVFNRICKKITKYSIWE